MYWLNIKLVLVIKLNNNYCAIKLEYQWFVNGKELPYGTKPDLVIKNVQLSDAGVYVCCVKSSNGSSVLTKGAEVIG